MAAEGGGITFIGGLTTNRLHVQSRWPHTHTREGLIAFRILQKRRELEAGRRCAAGEARGIWKEGI